MTTSADSLVICLHGVGASGRDLKPLAGALRARLATTAFECPDAPEPDARGPGRQWFSVVGVTPELRATRIAAARAGFDRVLREAIEAHGFADRLNRVALFGFSQGTIMALDAIVTGRWPVAAVVGSSGRLATGDGAAGPKATRVLLLHGEADPVIPAAESRSARLSLQALGFPAESRFYPGLGHTLSLEGVAAASEFLAACFAR